MKDRAAVGQRQKRVQVISYTTTKNDVNEDVEVSVSQGFLFAKMQDISGHESEEGKVIHIIDRTYTIPYNGTIKATGEQMNLLDVEEDKLYQIYYVQEVGRREQLLLKCRKRE